MREHISSFHKKYESHAAYPEQSTANFKNIANINVDSDTMTPQNKKRKRLRLSGI